MELNRLLCASVYEKKQKTKLHAGISQNWYLAELSFRNHLYPRPEHKRAGIKAWLSNNEEAAESDRASFSVSLQSGSRCKRRFKDAFKQEYLLASVLQSGENKNTQLSFIKSEEFHGILHWEGFGWKMKNPLYSLKIKTLHL